MDSPQSPRGGRRRRPRSLRFFAGIVFPLGALLALAVAVLLIGSSTLLRRSVDAVDRDVRSLDLVAEIESSTLGYTRTSNLWVSTAEPALENARIAAREGIREQVPALKALSDSTTEQTRVDALEDALERYFARREQLDRTDLKLSEILSRTRPSLNAVLDTIEDLEAMNRDRLARSKLMADQVGRVSRAVGLLVIVLVVATVATSIVWFQRALAGPLLGILDSIQRFRRGRGMAPAPERGPTEIRQIARAFNETTAALAEQREARLAVMAGVAHELRNPLSGIKMAIEVLRRQVDLGRQEHTSRSIEVLDRQIDRLTRLVDDLVEATRIEAGELVLAPRDYDLRRAAREAAELYRPTCPDHEIVLELPDTPVNVRVDPMRIEQVVGNLVSNAVKYSPQGGTVRIAVEVTDERAHLSVSDHGIGIAAEAVPDLFVPFRRVSASREVAPGSGLGLSIVRRIVDAHGGEIAVDSEPGRGSTFRVSVPRPPPS